MTATPAEIDHFLDTITPDEMAVLTFATKLHELNEAGATLGISVADLTDMLMAINVMHAGLSRRQRETEIDD